MDLTILAVVLLLCVGIPLRNKAYKKPKKKKDDQQRVIKEDDPMDSMLCVFAMIVFAYWFFIKRNKNT